MKVSARYAQEHFPDILTAASRGEEVEISLPGQPAFVLPPSEHFRSLHAQRRILG